MDCGFARAELLTGLHTVPGPPAFRPVADRRDGAQETNETNGAKHLEPEKPLRSVEGRGRLGEGGTVGPVETTPGFVGSRNWTFVFSKCPIARFLIATCWTCGGWSLEPFGPSDTSRVDSPRPDVLRHHTTQNRPGGSWAAWDWFIAECRQGPPSAPLPVLPPRRIGAGIDADANVWGFLDRSE